MSPYSPVSRMKIVMDKKKYCTEYEVCFDNFLALVTFIFTHPFIFFSLRRASVVHVVVCGMEQLPGVQLCDDARPVRK